MLFGWLSKSIPRQVLNLFIFSSNNRDVTLAEILCEATDEVALETKSENLGKKLCPETASSSIFWKEKNVTCGVVRSSRRLFVFKSL